VIEVASTISIISMKSTIARSFWKAPLAVSNNRAPWLIQGGGVTIGPEREKIADANATVTVISGLIVRVGNRKVVRVRVT